MTKQVNKTAGPKPHNLSVKLRADVGERLHLTSQNEGRSIKWLVEQALLAYLSPAPAPSDTDPRQVPLFTHEK